MRVLTETEAREVIQRWAPNVSEAVVIAARAILRQERVILVQLDPGEYAALQSNVIRLAIKDVL